tara:strand:- start:166 stop:339 length:174 start_codon:yes stop_codon:yes gene_type:complete
MLNYEIQKVIYREINILENHLKMKTYKNKWIGIGWISRLKNGDLIFKPIEGDYKNVN